MPTHRTLRVPRPAAIWLLGFIAIALIGGGMTADLTGQSTADQFVLSRWSVDGLRVYLWLEGAVFSGLVAALGLHVASTGVAFTRGGQSNVFGIPVAARPRLSPQAGYIFVVLGSALVALSLTTLVLLNSCRYMRIV